MGDTDFMNPTLTSLKSCLNSYVVMPVSLEISRNDLRPSFNSALRIDIS